MKKSELRQIIREEISNMKSQEKIIATYDPKLNKKIQVDFEEFTKNNLIKKSSGDGFDHYRMAEFPYTTPDGDTFDLEMIGYLMTDYHKNHPRRGADFDFGRINVFYKDKKVTSFDGSIVGGIALDIAATVRKAKRWLDKNGSELISSGKQPRMFDT